MGSAVSFHSMCNIVNKYRVPNQELVVVRYTCGCTVVSPEGQYPLACPFHLPAVLENKPAYKPELFVTWGGE